MPDWLSLDTLKAWWRILITAPHLSLMLIALCLGAGYIAARWRYAGKVETLEERLKLRDDRIAEYEKKLDGATPDEAKGRLDALEKLVGHLRPRDLTQRQKLALASALDGHHGHRVEVGYAMGDRVCEEYAEQLCQVFVSSGWPISKNAIVAPWARDFPGLAVIHRPNDGAPELRALLGGLNEAGIPFQAIPNPVDPNYVCRLSVGPIGSPTTPTPAVWGD